MIRIRRYGTTLTVLLLLFVLRVLAQALIALGIDGLLPPWEEWFSGLVPYPQLIASQLLIVLVLGKVCVDFERGRGQKQLPYRAACETAITGWKALRRAFRGSTVSCDPSVRLRLRTRPLVSM